MFKRVAVIIDPKLDCAAIFTTCKLLGKAGDAVLLAVPCFFMDKNLQSDESLSQTSMNPHAQKIRDFVRLCANAKIDYEIASSTPLQLKEAMNTIHGVDFVLLGRPNKEQPAPKLFEKNLRRLFIHSACPIFIASPAKAAMKNILVGWDGSPEAARTLKIHVQLFQHLKFHYLFVFCSDDSLSAQTQLHSASDYIAHHALSAETIALDGEPTAILTTTYKRIKAWQILIGLHRRNIFSKKKFGKTSKTLLRDDTISLFIYD